MFVNFSIGKYKIIFISFVNPTKKIGDHVVGVACGVGWSPRGRGLEDGREA
jgi:hypothetical protein